MGGLPRVGLADEGFGWPSWVFRKVRFHRQMDLQSICDGMVLTLPCVSLLLDNLEAFFPVLTSIKALTFLAEMAFLCLREACSFG
jgi:hypothetical protein